MTNEDGRWWEINVERQDDGWYVTVFELTRDGRSGDALDIHFHPTELGLALSAAALTIKEQQ